MKDLVTAQLPEDGGYSRIFVSTVVVHCWLHMQQPTAHQRSKEGHCVFLLKLKKAGQMTSSQKCEESDAGTSILDDWKTNSME